MQVPTIIWARNTDGSGCDRSSEEAAERCIYFEGRLYRMYLLMVLESERKSRAVVTPEECV